MGWSNYIIIPNLKLAIEISRSIDTLEYYEEEAIQKALDYQEDELPQKQATKLTLSEMSSMAEAVKILNNIPEDSTILFLFWLKKQNIEFEIISEFDFNKRKDEFKDFKTLGFS